MADKAISGTAELTTPAAGDLIPIVDISEADTSLKNKKITYGALTGVWTNWTPTTVGFSSFIASVNRYLLIGKTCFIEGRLSGFSDNTVTSITLPFTSANITGMAWSGALGAARDNGTYLTTPGRWTFGPNATVMAFYKDMVSGAWTASDIKEIQYFAIYEIA